MPEENPLNLDPQYSTAPTTEAGTSFTDLSKQLSEQGVDAPQLNDRPGERNMELEQANLEKMKASGIIQDGMNPDLLKEKLNLFTYGVENPNFSPVISSDQAREEINNLYNEAQTELNANLNELNNSGANIPGNGNVDFRDLPTPEYQQYQNFTGEIEDARTASGDLFGQLKQNIEEDFRLREIDQRNENRVFSGKASKQLAGMKAYGRAASAIDYMKNIDVRNQHEINKLRVEKNRLLIEATTAYQQQDWQMLQKKIEHSHKLTDQINEIEGWKLEDAIKTNDQLMEQARFGWDREDRAMGKMNDLLQSGLSRENITDEQVKDLEKLAGVPEGFFDQLYDIYQQEKTIEDATADIEYQKKLVDLLNQVPEGRTIMINGTAFTGWKKDDPNIWESIVTDAQGRVTFLVFNRDTGTLEQVDLGLIGSPKEGWQTVQTSDGMYRVNLATNQVDPLVTRGGNFDPSYIEGFDQWVRSLGTITVEFGGSTGFEAAHPGWDIAGQKGDPITAFQGGRIVQIDRAGTTAYGNMIVVEDAQGRLWQYGHLDTIPESLGVGSEISSGQYLGGMGNTGQVLTRDPVTGAYREPTPEEREAGRGSHLDLRAYMPGKQLKSTEAEDSVVKNVSQEEINIVASDISRVQEIEDRAEREAKYKAIRTQIGNTGGKDALAWFDANYPLESVVGAELPKLADLSDQKRAALSVSDLSEMAKNENLSFTQLRAAMGDKYFKNLTGQQIVDLGASMGASPDDVKSLLKDGRFWADKWDSEVKDYFNLKFANA